MGNVNYNEWLNGKRCCGQNNIISIARNCHHNHACDCDNILLDISKLYTNDEILQDEIDAISGNSGITSGEVQTMIDESISGKVDTTTFDAYTAYTANELNGKATKSQIVSINNNLDNIAGELFRYENETDAALAQKASTGSVSTLETNVALFEARTAGQIGELSESTARALSGKADTSAVTQEISAAVSGKQDTLIAGDNITISGNVISATGGSSITIDPSLDSGSTNPVANSAITEALNTKLDASAYTPTEQVQSDWNQTDSGATDFIKNKPIIPTVPTSNSAFTNDMHYVTSADTANYVTSGNVETQIVNHFWCGTQAEWSLISGNTQPNVLYLIHD